MGTGKTTVGRLLAAELDLELVDTDALIEDRHGPIPQIFETVGETGFRALEREVAAELGQGGGLVIATGGRMVLDPENERVLSRNGRIFCLTASPDEILRRLGDDIVDRPLLGGDDPDRREYDQLVSLGESKTIALLALAIQRLGHPARSFTGSQVQVLTDGAHERARIQHIDKERLLEVLDAGGIAVVAGFQGVSPRGDVTTLGRGGSDTTAATTASVPPAGNTRAAC